MKDFGDKRGSEPCSLFEWALDTDFAASIPLVVLDKLIEKDVINK